MEMCKVYRIDNSGNIEELATYSLPPQEAIKVAYMQFIQKSYNTWNYDRDFHVSIGESKNGYHISLDNGDVLWTRKQEV